MRAGKCYEVGVAANICSVRVYIYIHIYNYIYIYTNIIIYIRLAIIGLDFLVLVQHLLFAGYLRYLRFLFGIDIGKPNVNHLQCGHGWDISNHPNKYGRFMAGHYMSLPWFFEKEKKLVGGWKMCYFSIQLGIIIPTDELIFFRGVGQPPTRKQW